MKIEPFRNITTNGNEPAIRKGKSVPEGGIGLAYFKSPDLSPSKNIIVVDMSHIDDVGRDETMTHLFYANAMGVLEDEYYNQVVYDQFPYISDEFLDYDDTITLSDALPYVHVSRYFHVDHPGIALEGRLETYKTSAIKIVDKDGKEYLKNDKPAYKIKVIRSYNELQTYAQSFRIFAFIDSDGLDREDLYLQYNRVLITSTGVIYGQIFDYKEILNPQAVFSFVPEESEIADITNRYKKIYDSKPIKLKSSFASDSESVIEGYQVYVPKKAIIDPRLFQPFKWRIVTEFRNPINVSLNENDRNIIFCGVIETTFAKGSRAPFAFFNLQNSNYNMHDLIFRNPIRTVHSEDEQRKSEYWAVNFDLIAKEDLAKFHILIWAPNVAEMDFENYVGKIDYFVNDLGRTLILDTCNFTVPSNLGMQFSSAVNPLTNQINTWGAERAYVNPAGHGYATKSAVVESLQMSTSFEEPLQQGDVFLQGYDIDYVRAETLIAPYVLYGKSARMQSVLEYSYSTNFRNLMWADDSLSADYSQINTDGGDIRRRDKFFLLTEGNKSAVYGMQRAGLVTVNDVSQTWQYVVESQRKEVYNEQYNIPAKLNEQGQYVDTVTGELAYYGPKGEPGSAWTPGQNIPAGYEVHLMPDNRWSMYHPSVYNYPAGSNRPPNTPIIVAAPGKDFATNIWAAYPISSLAKHIISISPPVG